MARAYTAQQLGAELRRASRETDKALAAANRQLGREARGDMRSAAKSGSRLEAKMAGGIGTKAGKSSVQITVKNTRSAPGAQGAYWGAKKYRQFKPWVGASWQAGSKPGGPYVINPTLADKADTYAERYRDNVFGTLPGN